MRTEALLQTDDENEREFESLSRVERDERDSFGLRIEAVNVLDQSNFFQQRRETERRCQVSEVSGFGAKLENVGPTLLTIVGAVPDVLRIPRRFQREIEQVQSV